MSSGPSIMTFFVPRSPGKAAKEIRQALAGGGLAVSVEMDLSARLGRGFKIGFPACRVMCVDCPASLLEALVFDRSAAVLLPIHLVVTDHEGGTAVHMLNPSAHLYETLPITSRPAVSKLIEAVTECLHSISTRTYAGSTV